MAENTPPTPDPAPAGVQIGADQWVAQADERTARPAGIGGRITHLWERVPPAGKLAFLTPAILLPFLPFINEGNLFNYGVFILIYALLALGLNVVVGFAGLLDLGYVAFFGFGAYVYAFLSGTHHEKGHSYTHHWSGQYSILLAVLICALLGLFLGSSSRRLLGDYLAIVTLFFGQAFVVFTNAADPYGITNGSNGLANVDPLKFSAFGHHVTIGSVKGYYWFLLGCVVVVLIVLWCIAESRTGRAWKASREDPLAAEMMGMPVNRLKIMAFSFGAAIAGLAGSVFAAAQTGAFPQNFSTQVLILIYAVVILGGTGSLTGMVVGAIVIIASNQVLDSTSPPNVARVLFYAALIATIVLTMKSSWKRLVAAFAGTAAFGFAVHAIADAVWSHGTKGQVTSGGFLTGVIRNWVVLPTNPGRLAVYGYLLMLVFIIALAQLKGWWRLVLLVPTLYLTAFVWENLLVQQPSVTRYVLFGALLIAVMTIRPQGLFGTAKVEIA
jgi:branched-chain amino acid transport system permease protein